MTDHLTHPVPSEGLIGEALDHAVAEALGGVLDGDGWSFDPPLMLYGHEASFIKTKRSFCEDWSYGGPIIEANRIDLTPMDYSGKNTPCQWRAFIPWDGNNSKRFYGDTPLEAAMRAFVGMPR